MDDLLDEIRQKLAKISDGNLFEEFVGHTLTDEIPGFTPVAGGGDFGRDGEAPSDKGAAPLTCTIQEDVIGNMTKTLKRYKKNGGKATIAYAATSQRLTNTKKQNLRDRAQELDFTLQPIYDADFFVIKLYKDAEWRKKLLGITGALPALSKVPWTTRTALDIPIIGRDEELAKLEKIDGDILISGQPGSGKTFLTDHFAKTHNALFVISDDLTKIADEVREKSPNYLIIDDIHSKEKLLQAINNLRTQQGLSFKIMGVTWSSGEANIKAKMGLADGNVIKLRELPRDDIVSVIDACGLKNALNELKKEIVDQSKGKPGLAITLSNLCLGGDWQKVFNGDSLYSLVVTSFNSRLGRDVTTLLSFIALGGDAGIGLAKLAQISGTPIGDVKAILDELSFGGVISAKDDGNVSIEPASLRYPLIRELFFAGTATLKFEDYIEQYPSVNDVIESLLITSLKGAELDSSRITPYLNDEMMPQTWAYFAALGEAEAEHVAQNNRKAIIAVPQPILYRQPKVAIRELLVEAANDRRELHSYPNHPVRILKDWAENAQPGHGEAVGRRKAIVEAANELMDNGYQDQKTIGRALAAGLNPDYEKHQTDPGFGKTLTFVQGYMSPDEFKQMRPVIELADKVFQKLSDDEAFAEILGIADDWVYNRQAVSTAYLDQISEVKKEMAQLLLGKIYAATQGHPLIQRRTRQLGNVIGLDLKVEAPKEYEILFPFESRSARREEALFQQQLVAVKALAKEWSEQPPEQIAKRLAELQIEAAATNTSYPNYLHWLLPAICESLPDSKLLEWAEHLLRHSPSAMLTSDIASRIAAMKPDGYETILKSMLENEIHRVSAVLAIIKHFSYSAEPTLFELAKPHLSKYAQSIDTLCLRGEISTDNEIFILDNVDEDAAVIICGGIAFQYSEKEMPEGLKEKWETAIISHSTGDYHATQKLEYLLEKHPQLILPWFKSKLNLKVDQQPGRWLHIDTIAQKTIDTLSKDDKKELVSLMDSSEANDSMVDILVGNDLEIYKELLDNKAAKDHHLRPLTIYSENWTDLALAALDAGYSKEDIKKQSFHFNFGWSGSAANMWEARKAEMLSHIQKTDNPDIVDIAKECAANIDTYIERAREEERLEAVNGI